MTIDVLGLGESLNEYANKGNITIGVNDIYSRYNADYVVCVDTFEAFTKDRLKTILHTKCKGFYSQLECWKTVQNYVNIKVSRTATLTDDTLKCSNNSPFVACVLAYKMGATEIVLWGVDMNTHNHFKGLSFDKAVTDYKQLKNDLARLGVSLSIGSETSKLHGLLK